MNDALVVIWQSYSWNTLNTPIQVLGQNSVVLYLLTVEIDMMDQPIS